MAARFTLSSLSHAWKLLLTGFVLVLCAGYLSGALNAALSVGITAADIAGHYGPEMIPEAELQMLEQDGFIEEEFSLDDPDPTPMEADAHAGHEMGGATAINAQQMAQLAHVHLLGFAMILLSVGALACLSGFSETAKGVVVTALFLCLSVDIGGLYLVRFVDTGFAALNMVAGIGIGVCLAVISVRVLWELWLAPNAPV